MNVVITINDPARVELAVPLLEAALDAPVADPGDRRLIEEVIDDLLLLRF